MRHLVESLCDLWSQCALARAVVLVHPNYHSGGAEIAGNWPPAWVAYLAGS
jgi:hypothetical protein